MENADGKLTKLDKLYLQRANELAARAIGSTLPNPPAGAVVVRDDRVIGEGYHHRTGDPHAEPEALRQAGAGARGATVYVSVEPCRHVGRTPPCTNALIEAGVARVVVGARDPTEHGGAKELREGGIAVDVADDPAAQELIAMFVRTMERSRPYIALKMAMSLDGFVTSRPGVRERLGSPAEEAYVRDLRTAYDAVMVGAGTIRIDDPMLTVRPPHDRVRPYVRVVACGRDGIVPESRIFAAEDGYERTILLVPTAQRVRFEPFAKAAEVIYVGEADAAGLDLAAAMTELRAHGVMSVLCEGGPKLGASILAAGLVDRIYWLIAPRFLSGEQPVPVLSGADLRHVGLRFDGAERVGPDLLITGTPCSAD